MSVDGLARCARLQPAAAQTAHLVNDTKGAVPVEAVVHHVLVGGVHAVVVVVITLGDEKGWVSGARRVQGEGVSFIA